MAGNKYSNPSWDDFVFVGHARTVGAAPADFVNINSTGIYGWEFTNGEELYFPCCQLSHAYKVGTELIPHIHWMPSTSATYTGTWTLEWIEHVSIAAGTAMSSKSTATLAFNSSLTAWQAQIGNFSANLTSTNRGISSIVQLKLSLALSAGTSCFLLGLDAHYQRDGLGSDAATSKS